MADDKTLEQNGTTPTNSTCEMLLGGTEFRNVMSISDAPAIKDIFRYKWWTVEEGLFYLTGAFSLVGNTEDSDQDRLITLDGREFRDPGDSEVIDYFWSLHTRLKKIWDRSRLVKDQYSPAFFLRWGRSNADVFTIFWLNDALEKGLVRSTWLEAPDTNKKITQREDTELGEKERQTLYKIIAGLIFAKHGTVDHGTLKAIERDTERAGCHVSENTISKHVRAAEQYLPNKTKA